MIFWKFCTQGFSSVMSIKSDLENLQNSKGQTWQKDTKMGTITWDRLITLISSLPPISCLDNFHPPYWILRFWLRIRNQRIRKPQYPNINIRNALREVTFFSKNVPFPPFCLLTALLLLEIILTFLHLPETPCTLENSGLELFKHYSKSLNVSLVPCISRQFNLLLRWKSVFMVEPVTLEQ